MKPETQKVTLVTKAVQNTTPKPYRGGIFFYKPTQPDLGIRETIIPDFQAKLSENFNGWIDKEWATVVEPGDLWSESREALEAVVTNLNTPKL